MPAIHSRSRTITGQQWTAAMPLSTHWGPVATCEDIGCMALAQGWKTYVPVGSREEQAIRQRIKEKGWSHTEDVVGDTVFFIFAAGTPCFNDGRHRAQLEREAVLVHRDADTGKQEPMRRQSWHDRWAEHLDRLARMRGE